MPKQFIFGTFRDSHLQYMYNCSGSFHFLFNSGNLEQRLHGLPLGKGLGLSGVLVQGVGAYGGLKWWIFKDQCSQNSFFFNPNF